MPKFKVCKNKFCWSNTKNKDSGCHEFHIVDTCKTYNDLEKLKMSPEGEALRNAETLLSAVADAKDTLIFNLPSGTIDALEILNLINDHLKTLDNIIQKHTIEMVL